MLSYGNRHKNGFATCIHIHKVWLKSVELQRVVPTVLLWQEALKREKWKPLEQQSHKCSEQFCRLARENSDLLVFQQLHGVESGSGQIAEALPRLSHWQFLNSFVTAVTL